MIFLIARSLSEDSRINIAFGILAFILSLVSIIVGIATWRVHHRATTHTDDVENHPLYDFEIRIGRRRELQRAPYGSGA
ncbi:uncharacterized protein K441DRAFT_653211 [Cenococcum geophilum 1.58]|uniref:uncharacterized protein n=1 Tax=Cenococcum geophilum 1.58 TaxID=794803 RepID=UPI0035901281|nr:hypothetical protein K441DRAFT_653211 [Cenococcum geophilum 1.58]